MAQNRPVYSCSNCYLHLALCTLSGACQARREKNIHCIITICSLCDEVYAVRLCNCSVTITTVVGTDGATTLSRYIRRTCDYI